VSSVIEQTIEFPDAKAIQGATLSLEGSDEIITGEVQEDDGRKKVVFVLPDSSEGRNATANVIVDDVAESYPIVIGSPTPVIRTSRSQLTTGISHGGWFFGAGASAGRVSSDFATTIAQQSALDAEGFLAGQGVTNIVSGYNADDDAIAWDGSLEVGYWFPDDSRLSLGFSTGSADDFALNVDVSGDVPPSSIVNAQSVGTAELDIWSVALDYARFFTPTSNFGFVVSVGNQSVKRPTTFTSTLSVADKIPCRQSSAKRLNGLPRRWPRNSRTVNPAASPSCSRLFAV